MGADVVAGLVPATSTLYAEQKQCADCAVPAPPVFARLPKCPNIGQIAKSKRKPREALMNKLIIPATIAAIAAASAVAWSQAPAPNPNVKIYYTTPLENDASRIVRLQSITIPPKEGNNFHRHPGDQWSAVQEGEVTLTIKGQEPRTLKVGDSAYIPRGTVHRNQNLTDKPARTIELNIMDKDKPLLEPVTQ
jgi:quercetin dioxygenase-like cupin family protein